MSYSHHYGDGRGSYSSTSQEFPEKLHDESLLGGTQSKGSKYFQNGSWKHNTHLALSFLAGIMWLGPGVWMLYVNFSGFVIGGKAWCPSRNCAIITFNYGLYINGTTPVSGAVAADKEAHYLLGFLQFVAKAFEIWFMCIAGSLIYTVSHHIAARPGGLPLGYLLAHLKFADLRILLNPVTWTSSWPSRQGVITGERQHRFHLHLFALLLVCMSIISNFIGPLTAVLLNPVLDWDDGGEDGKVAYGRFDRMLADGPVMNGHTPFKDQIPECEEAQLSTGNYSCLDLGYSSSLDAVVESAVSSMDQRSSLLKTSTVGVHPNWDILDDLSTSDSLLVFSFNVSRKPGEKTVDQRVTWSPNRQVIRGLAYDLFHYFNYTTGEAITPPDAFAPSARKANNSVQLEVHREGPIVGRNYYASYGIPRTAFIDNDSRQIRCFDKFVDTYISLDGSDIQSWAKCYQYGNWASTSSSATLTIQGLTNNSNDSTTMNFYWSDKFAYFKVEDFTSWQEKCIRNYTSIDDFNRANDQCGWETNFNKAPPDRLLNFGEGLVTEYRVPNQTAYKEIGDSEDDWTLVSEFRPFVSNGTYSVDITNVFLDTIKVIMADVHDETDVRVPPMVLNSTWMLASWMSDNGSTINAAESPAAKIMHYAVHQFYGGDFEGLAYWVYADQVASLQSLSLVTYDTMAEDAPTDDPYDHPIFESYLRRQVWKYGKEERTRKFGLGVTFIGCLVVLVRSVLVLVDRSVKPTSTEMLRGALEHRPGGEFEGKKGKRQSGRVRFRITQGKNRDVDFSAQ